MLQKLLVIALVYPQLIWGGVIGFKWTDPTEGIWGGTKLVIKKDSVPKNENDGVIIQNSIVKNQYNENNIEVTFGESLDSGTYYAALFPYSPLGIINPMAACMTSFKYRGFVTFESCTFNQLSEMVEDGSAHTAFKVGDVKTIELNNGSQTQLRIVRIDNTDKLKRIFLETINCPFSAGAKTVVNIARKFMDEQLPTELHSMAKTIKHITTSSSSASESTTFYLPSLCDYDGDSSFLTGDLNTRLTYYKGATSEDKSLLIKTDINGEAIRYGVGGQLNNISHTITTTGATTDSVSCPIQIPIVFVI